MSSLALSNQNATGVKSAILKVIQGPNKGDMYRIQPPGAVIGRDPGSCQIVLADDRVSRQQCRIDFKFNGIFVEDLSGKSTTFVNLQGVATQILATGDQLGFGDTIFEITFEKEQPMALVGGPSGYVPSQLGIPSQADFTPEKEPFLNKKNIFRIAFVLILLGAVYIINKKQEIKPAAKIASPDEVDQAIEAVQKRQEELRKPKENMTPQDSYNRRSAEKYFTKGFRDFQNRSYTRAIESFQTALAVLPTYVEAKRYLKLSEKRRQDLISAHMDLGNKYKAKSMYKYCIAEFEKVLQIINRPEDKKYQLAKEQIQECRLLQQGTD
ncbi:MAG: FHA domain-containing protein [Bdellovibrionaceae bacterium]|nr:FHA domain-containing protein [Pseudobdellovibrionaceae bacterium]